MLHRFPRRADARLFVALATVGLLLAAVAVAGSLGAIGRVFPGFVVWDDLVVVALGRPSWTGVRADVPFRTRVVGVDDVRVDTRSELTKLVAAAAAGTPHRYAVDDGNGVVERVVASMRFRPGDWVATMGVYVLNGLAFLLTGLAVFWLNPDSKQSRAVLAFGWVWGLTLLLAVDLFTAGRLQDLYFSFEAAAPAAALHIALRFPEGERGGRLITGAYAIAVVVGLVQVWAFHHSYPLLIAVNDAVYLALAAAGVLSMTHIARAAFGRRATPLARRRARVVLAGAIVAFGLPLPAMLAFFVSGEPVSFSSLTLAGFVFPLSIGYAVARHDLFEADRFVRQSLVWATVTALVALAYGATVLVGDRLAAELAIRQSPLFPIAFVVAVLAVIVPLRDRVQRGVDRLFRRGRVDYKDTIAHASERMTTLLQRDAVVRHVIATARDVLFLEGVTVWELAPDGLVRRNDGDGAHRIAADDPGLVALSSLDRPVSADEIAQSPRFRERREALGRLLAALGATLVVPLLRDNRPAGWLGVAGKASGGALSADDLDVLRTLADQTAVALGTAAAVEQLAEARRGLANAERLAAIGELSAAVAHGIRNPLAGIRLATQLGLESAARDDPVRENLEDVLSEVDKLETQVRGILDFARPFEPRLEPVALDGLVRGILATLGARLDAGRIVADVHVAVDLPAVMADRAHLGQALQELVGNAIEAMPDGGRLSIEGSASGRDGRRTVRIVVGDTGPGIRPEVRDRVFQLFMTTKARGTGVGLSVVRKIVERHGGTVRLGDGPGARFEIELPSA
jgi:signal transduction histidine kinase